MQNGHQCYLSVGSRSSRSAILAIAYKEHIRDISNDRALEVVLQSEQVLEGVGSGNRPILTVLNRRHGPGKVGGPEIGHAETIEIRGKGGQETWHFSGRASDSM